jgi:hypothetical protein
MKNVELFILAFCLLMVTCGTDDPINKPIDLPEFEGNVPTITDEELLTLTQQETFKYFWDFSESNSGAARERYHPNDPSNDANTVTTGGSGFGLMGILVGIERNFISRAQGAERLNQILTFFENADRFHGAWPHWINGENGTVKPFSPQDDGGDLVETAFLAQGLICIKEYFKNGTDSEKVLAEKADVLWKGIEWDWYTQGEDVLYWHWSLNYNFNMDFRLQGYNEVLITYIMAAASPGHAISKEVYTKGWADNGNLTSSNTAYNFPLLVKHNGAQILGGPLFWAHYSYLGLNPHGLTDDYVDYWDVNVNHSLINYSYCVDNPKGYRDYGNDCWGLTASYTRNAEGDIGYSGHSPGNDLGVISPTAAISSMPYTPNESLKALHYFYRNKDKLLGPAGFYDAFSPAHNYWVAEAYLAIDQGPIIIMIENYRTGLLWDLFMQNEDIRSGLDKLDFSYTQ